MAHTSGRGKQATISVRVPAELKAAFEAAADEAEQSAAEVMRTPMETYVAARRGNAEHDAWFRQQVQRALDDPRRSRAHAEVVADVMARLEARIAGTARGAR